MTRYLLDTNIVSFLLKQSHPALERRFWKVPRTEIALSSVTEGELRYGVARLPAEARLRELVDGFLQTIEVLAWDSACAQMYAKLRAQLETGGEPMGFADTMIAAHALSLGVIVVTNDQALRRIKALKVQDWTRGPQRS